MISKVARPLTAATRPDIWANRQMPMTPTMTTQVSVSPKREPTTLLVTRSPMSTKPPMAVRTPERDREERLHPLLQPLGGRVELAAEAVEFAALPVERAARRLGRRRRPAGRRRPHPVPPGCRRSTLSRRAPMPPSAVIVATLCASCARLSAASESPVSRTVADQTRSFSWRPEHQARGAGRRRRPCRPTGRGFRERRRPRSTLSADRSESAGEQQCRAALHGSRRITPGTVRPLGVRRQWRWRNYRPAATPPGRS